MGNGIITNDANASGAPGVRSIRQIVSDRTNLVAEFLFGRDVRTSIENSAGSNGSLVNAVTSYGDHFLQTTVSTGGIDTGITVGSAYTMLLACQAYATDDSGFPNGANVFYAGCALYDANAPQVYAHGADGRMYCYFSPSQVLVSGMPARPYNDYRVFALRGNNAADQCHFDEFKAGALVQSVNGGGMASRGAAANSLQIGTARACGGADQIKFAAAVVYNNRYLSDAELLTAYLDVYNFFKKFGINS